MHSSSSVQRMRTVSPSPGVRKSTFRPEIPRLVEHAPPPGDVHPLSRKMLLRLLPELRAHWLKGISRIELRGRVSKEVGDPLGTYSPRDQLVRLYSVPYPYWPHAEGVLNPNSRLARCGAVLVDIDGAPYLQWQRPGDLARYYAQTLAHELAHHYVYRRRRRRSLPETLRGHEQVADRFMWRMGMARAFKSALAEE
jgi:hypothetical protein